MTDVVSERPIAFTANPDASDTFADSAVGAFVNNGNVHITLAIRRCDYSRQPNVLSDVVVGRLIMPLAAAERMAQFLTDCVRKVKHHETLSAGGSVMLQ